MTQNLSTQTEILNAKPEQKAPLQVAIIGAGLTGLMTAHLLEQAYAHKRRQIKITLFEKSRGVGRLATRYIKPSSEQLNTSQNATHTRAINNQPNSNYQTSSNVEDNKQWQFDFGAQFFTAKSLSFRQYIKTWLQDGNNSKISNSNGCLVAWHAQTAYVDDGQPRHLSSENICLGDKWNDEQPRYIATPKMTTWGRQIVKTLQYSKIQYKTRVAPLVAPKNGATNTNLYDEDNNHLGSFDWVICTAPQQQAIDLIQHSGFSQLSAIQHLKMLACYTLMLGWHKVEDMPTLLQLAKWSVLDILDINATTSNNAGQVQSGSSALGRVFIENRKPGRDQILPSVTIHAGNQWSQANVDCNIDVVQKQLLTIFNKLFDSDQYRQPIHIDCHRWRYAATEQSVDEVRQQLAYVDNNKRWIVTGDWCGQGRIESCFEAATATVNILLKNAEI